MNNLPGARAIRLWVSRWFHCDYTGMIATQKHWRGRWGFVPFVWWHKTKAFAKIHLPGVFVLFRRGETTGMLQKECGREEIEEYFRCGSVLFRSCFHCITRSRTDKVIKSICCPVDHEHCSAFDTSASLCVRVGIQRYIFDKTNCGLNSTS